MAHLTKLQTTTTLIALCFLLPYTAPADDFRSGWQADASRVWLGPEYWANPLQDWRVHAGRIECDVSGDNRNVSLLTHQLADKPGAFEVSVRLGCLIEDPAELNLGWAGLRIGAKGQLNDYRDSALRGVGIDAGVTTRGRLFISDANNSVERAEAIDVARLKNLVLRLKAEQVESRYTLTLTAFDPADEKPLALLERARVLPQQLVGNVAIVCDHDARSANDAKTKRKRAARKRAGARGGNVRFWFREWHVLGEKVEAHPEQAFGPILFAQHTLSRGTLKLTAQMPPVGERDAQSVRLQIQRGENTWKTIAVESIDELARTATFRIENWDATTEKRYRLAYAFPQANGLSQDHYWNGTIRRDPSNEQTLVVAGFTGNTDAGFPNTEIVKGVAAHDPHLLVFTGDQIYESVAGYGIQREPLETASLDYLRKWYLLGWAFRDLMRDRPTICLPDDHDVYQGNIWGGGGRKVTMADHATGGYAMDPQWVNMVQRTQTSHLPDPFDPTPVAQEIGVYYTELHYGRVGIAILEDRKFKSGPQGLVPPTGGRPDHVTDPNFDPQSVDVPGAKLLGDRQLKFLREFASNWKQTDMKMSVSQTIFANVANYHGANKQYLVADLDSNGWPQTGRNKALDELRRGYVFMLAGDQHLASIVHHGIDAFEDAGVSFCVPSIAAGYPRSWLPEKPGANHIPGRPGYTGQFREGLGNRVTVHAAANPQEQIRTTPIERLHDKASGYGIVRLDKQTRKITIECWPLLSNPKDPSQGGQFEGWPMTIDMHDNYGRKAAAHLPTIEVKGMQNPVIQVVDEASGETAYTLRIKGTTFRPKVFRAGTYTVHVGEPSIGKVETFKEVTSAADADDVRRLSVTFEQPPIQDR